MSPEDIIEGVPLPLLVIAPDYRIIAQNGSAIEMFGRSVLGNSAVSVLRQAPVLAAMDSTVRDKEASEARFVLTGAHGEVTYGFKTHPLPEGGAVLCFEDASHQDEASTIRRDFVANISHELRTPLTSLMGFIETLRGPAKDDAEAQQRFLEIMDGEARRMSRMVSDLLSLSRVEADERVRPRDLVDVAGAVRSVLATLEGKLKTAEVSLETQGLDLPAMVRGDRDQLIQLFLNLVENAIKYGGAGNVIEVRLLHVEHDATLRCPAVQVDVRDHGPGIDPIHVPRLTERFYRVDGHRNREQGGTGLGLAIVKHIINRHRGRLKITSKQEVGSCFSVILPTS